MKLILAVIITGIVVGTYFLLRNKSDKAKLIPFMIMGAFLVLFEIAKIIIGFQRPEGFRNLWLPFHVCSLFVFIMAPAAFLKQGSKASNIFWAASLLLCVMLIVGTIVAPSMITGDQSRRILTGATSDMHWVPAFMDWHSVIFHAVPIAFFILLLIFKPYKPQRMELVYGGIIFAGFMAVALIMANVLSVNFASFSPNSNDLIIQLALYVAYLVGATLACLAIVYFPKLMRRTKTKETTSE